MRKFTLKNNSLFEYKKINEPENLFLKKNMHLNLGL